MRVSVFYTYSLLLSSKLTPSAKTLRRVIPKPHLFLIIALSMSRVALSRNIFAIVSSYLSSLSRTAFFFSFYWIRFSLFFLSRGISSLVTFLRLPSSSGTVSVVRSGRALAPSLSFSFHRIGLVSLSHISSPSISLFSASSVLVVPPMYLTFVHSLLLARVASRGVASRSILTNTPLVFPFFSLSPSLFLSLARTHIHTHTHVHSFGRVRANLALAQRNTHACLHGRRS